MFHTLPATDERHSSRGQTPSGLFRNLGSRSCDLFCVAFGVWTLLCNLVVLLGGNLYHLLWISLGTLVAALGIAARYLRTPRESQIQARNEEDIACQHHQGKYPPLWISISALSALAVVLLASHVRQDTTMLWCGASCYFLYMLWWDFRLPSETLGQDKWTNVNECAVWGVALIVLVMTFFWAWPSADDSFYLSVAVSTADQPQLPLLSFDTIYGMQDLPLLLPTYRVHSVELLSGALSFLTGIPAIYLAHVVIPALVIPLIPIIYAKLFRLLIPGRAVWATLIVGLIMVVPVSYLVVKWRIVVVPQMGKTMYIGAFIPLIICYGVQFGRCANWRNFLLLAAAQIGAVGMTATALWQGPVVAFLAVAASVDVNRTGAKRLATGVLSSAYVLGLAILLRQITQASTVGTMLEQFGSGQLFQYAYDRVPFGSFAFVFVCVTWWACRESTCRRICLLFPLAMLVFWNPLCPNVLASNLTGYMTYFRVLWILPTMFSVAVVLTMPLTLTVQNRRSRFIRNALTICAVGVSVIAPQVYGLKSHPLARMAMGRLQTGQPQLLKVTRAYWIAKDLNRIAGERNRVLAPEEIETWVTTIHGYSYPVCSRHEYFNIMSSHFTEEDRNLRVLAHRYISQPTRGPQARRALRGLLETDERLTAVCIQESHPQAFEIAGVLERSGFERCAKHRVPRLAPKFHYDHFEIWKRVPREVDATELAANKTSEMH